MIYNYSFFDVCCLLELLILYMQLTNLASQQDLWVNLLLSNGATDRIYTTFLLYLVTKKIFFTTSMAGLSMHSSVHVSCYHFT